ncbi:muramoyltetrapeptide carboxypeptidase [Dyadobacter jejuensis]|uniref:Muramoyltetrapeptide carboxypeptidase n=1 Tax=Dyadobacter jejuensis TaxID=1082580 RepID=A0A316AKJ0_9BACT|nr:LD-carboxypeptidase [Dyadobacter jejuensis]PWJ58295.1 muramoyltetrapeptide carboxypeptidase [Dyadobacter jejuensis]
MIDINTSPRRPADLRAGDAVGLLAPASIVRYEDLQEGIATLTDDWGLKVVEGQTLHSGYFQFSDTDQRRSQDLQTMLDHPELKAIFAARGGYGCSRIIDQLDFTKFLENPKWIIGFSDLTVLGNHLYNIGVQSIHGPMVKSMSLIGAEQASLALKNMLFGEEPAYHCPPHALNRLGRAEGNLVGGNLCLLSHLIGSASEVDTRGCILFIEDINEYLYNLDRMMLQLKRAGKLAGLAGIIIGQFTDMKDNSDPTFGQTYTEIIAEHIQEYHYPVCHNFPAGHVADNRPLRIGAPAVLEVSATESILYFSNTNPITRS